MSDVTRMFFLRHLRGGQTTWTQHVVGGKARRAGVGLSFWFRPRVAVISEVPIDDRELPLLFHARTADFADVTVQATVTFRIGEPAMAADRLDFGIDPATGKWRGQPLDQLATVLAELAQQPALDLLIGMPLTEALAAVTPAREAIAASLAGHSRLTSVGVTVVGVRVVAIRPEPELERALQTPTREAVQSDADRATYQRRAQAVERERAIAENELQNKIELARREQQLVEQRGANSRRSAELKAEAELVATKAEAERDRVAVDAQATRWQLEAESRADRDRKLSAAKAEGTRAIGLAEAETETAKLAAYRDLPSNVLLALAAKELAGKLPEIGQLTVTPDVLTGLVAKLGGDPGSGQ